MIRFSGRGFGPGLPPEGAMVAAVLDGHLRVEQWTESGSSIPIALLAIERSNGKQLHLMWQSGGETCALVVTAGVGAGDTPSSVFADIQKRLPSLQPHAADLTTRRWLGGLIFLVVVLPCLLLMSLFMFRGEILDSVVEVIPVEQEIHLAEKLWQVQGAAIPKITGTAANSAVEQLGARLVTAAPTPYQYQFFISKDESVNAFAMPAGYIVVHAGLIRRAKSAEELAGVLAHEIAHVEQRHAVRGIVQSLGFTALWLALSGDIGTTIAGEGVRQLAGLHFSREQEVAADEAGFARLRAAKIAPAGMVSFFSSLSEKGDVIPESMTILSSHPSSAERSERLQKLLVGLPVVAPLPIDWQAVQASIAK
jgi:beta-barrel assembly-enhancing protease